MKSQVFFIFASLLAKSSGLSSLGGVVEQPANSNRNRANRIHHPIILCLIVLKSAYCFTCYLNYC